LRGTAIDGKGVGCLCSGIKTQSQQTQTLSARSSKLKSKARLEDWVKDHRDDKGFLKLLNLKQTPEKCRHDVINRALSGRRDNKKGILDKRTRNRMELEAQNGNSFELKDVNNGKLIKTHQNKAVLPPSSRPVSCCCE
jgi:hypothetical protein